MHQGTCIFISFMYMYTNFHFNDSEMLLTGKPLTLVRVLQIRQFNAMYMLMRNVLISTLLNIQRFHLTGIYKLSPCFFEQDQGVQTFGCFRQWMLTSLNIITKIYKHSNLCVSIIRLFTCITGVRFSDTSLRLGFDPSLWLGFDTFGGWFFRLIFFTLGQPLHHQVTAGSGFGFPVT